MSNIILRQLARFGVLMIVICHGVLPVFAAKTVPTIQIEIPRKNAPDHSEPPIPEKTTPTIPLSTEDLLFSDDNEETEPKEGKPDQDNQTVDHKLEQNKPAVIFYGDKDLPEAVKITRQKLLDAAHSGDVNALLPIFQEFSEVPILSFDNEGDPISFLKSSSGDGEGREILAILLEVLESGYVRRDQGDEGEIYIWPYFVNVPPEDLKPDQLVELFRIITAGDFEDMQAYGTYIFYRAGIAPNGELKFFVAGD